MLQICQFSFLWFYCSISFGALTPSVMRQEEHLACKIQIGLTFLMPDCPGCPGKETIKRVPCLSCFLQYGDTPLHTAARYGHAGVTRILLSAKCAVSETNKVRMAQPLHCITFQF